MAMGFDQGWAIGAPCFFNDEGLGWIEGKVEKVVGVGRSATLTLRSADGRVTTQREASEVEAASSRALDGVDDMVQLDELTEATVLSTLRVRYRRKDIYTNVGGILIAVNPYETLEAQIYGEEQMHAYGSADAAFAGMTPHPYLLAEAALRALDRDRESQSFVISGESGSGKTETCKYVLRYLSYRSKRRYEHSIQARGDGKANALEESVLLSNPILEAFGNAKTLRNDNSSRWGKYTQVYVQPSSGSIKRVGITAYLLEKVRIVERAKGERNYHILYQMVAGAAAAKGKDPGLALTKGLGADPVAHAVLRDDGYGKDDGGNASVAAIDVDDAVQFAATRDALLKLQIEETGLVGALSAVCHLGDVCFDEVADDHADSIAAVGKNDMRKRGGGFLGMGGGDEKRHAIDIAAEALGVNRTELEESLLSRRVAGVRVPRRAAEAEHAKAAFAKALYSRVFDWVLARVNDALKAMTGTGQTLREALTGKKQPKEELLTIGLLDIFGFECFAHNSLEQLLINYANERLLREFNKQDVKKGPGVFVPQVRRSSTVAERSTAGKTFGVSHFAADVVYEIGGFVEKNRDRLPEEICSLVSTSDALFVAGLFADRYVAGSFAESLAKLTGLLDETAQSFVRCVKPNHKAAKEAFDGVVVLDQLRCMGMLELVSARARGYAGRMDHDMFTSRYGILMEDAKDVDMAAFESADKAKLGEFLRLLATKKFIKPECLSNGEIAIGKTKVFLKRGAQNVLETAREARLCADVLLALGEATASRDANALELTLRIADELRLGETEEARLARATLTDERAYREIVEAAETRKQDHVVAALAEHNFPVDDGAAKKGNKKEDLPFAAGQWFSGAEWSTYFKDMTEGNVEALIPKGEAARGALLALVKERKPVPEDIESPPLPYDALQQCADELLAKLNEAEKLARQISALKALKAAIAAKDATLIAAALAGLRQAAERGHRRGRGARARAMAAERAKEAAKQAALKQAEEAKHAALEKQRHEEEAARKKAHEKHQAELQAKADAEAAAAAEAKAKEKAAEEAERLKNLPPPPPGAKGSLESLSEEELARVRERRGSKRERNSQLQRLVSRPFSTRERELNKSRSKQMEGLVQQEVAAIRAEEEKLKAKKQTLFGAEWKNVRLEAQSDASGQSLLASDPTFKNMQSRTNAYLTWPSNTLIRRGSRKLALGSITGVHIGTNAKQWCTMVPTEWHYMTLTTTRERSYDFGFEDATELLLWVNTLQRITFPEWTQQCNAGEMSELFKGAISDAQHRFYRSSRAGAASTDYFVPSLQELCPVLYPLAPVLCGTCAELGVSFANAAPRPPQVLHVDGCVETNHWFGWS
ncbi:hypothetical protein JL720_4931 [Aureococcus anophagefferens]|nr:hypothetical protein JL720_4931 [Aureococcus anophagefferens]